jgi:hypothetical protein
MLTSARAPSQLDQVVGGQLLRLSAAAHLTDRATAQLVEIFANLTRESLARPVSNEYPGLAQINANGLPLQWSMSIGATPSVRFLCESGRPGTSLSSRLALTRQRLDDACRTLGLPATPDWYDECVLAHALPHSAESPAHWRSAMWIGVGAAAGTVALKPYVNLNRDRPLDRWRRIGWVHKALGRDRALEQLCKLSNAVSEHSWPVGLAIDISADGQPGRIKTYFRSGAVSAAWLETWYAAMGADGHLPAVREMLDAFPHAGRATYPDRSFVVTLESHRDDGTMSLKTDLAVTKWMVGDLDIARGTSRLLARLGLESDGLDRTLDVLGAAPLSNQRCDVLRFVGLGYEPDGSRHVNVYLEPPTCPVTVSRPHVRRNVHSVDATDSAVRKAVAWLLAQRRDQHWSDYALPVGTADSWVTAYVLARLGQASARIPDRAAADALDWLMRARMHASGWGYNERTAADADSTALAVLALRAYGRVVPPDAHALLRRCMKDSGGVSTYPPGSSPAGAWVAAVSDVTPGALRALDMAPGQSVDWLLRQRGHDGLWPSYWWVSPLYPTAMAIELLTEYVSEGSALESTRTALQSYAPAGAFETALLLDCRRRLAPHTTAELVRQLVAEQNADGSWPASAYLRLTRPDVAQPSMRVDSGVIYLDEARVFTTATVVGALAQISVRTA